MENKYKNNYRIPALFALSLFIFTKIVIFSLYRILKDRPYYINYNINISQNLILNIIFCLALLAVYIIWFRKIIINHKAILNQEKFPVIKSCIIALGLFGMTVLIKLFYNSFIIKTGINIDNLNSMSLLNIKSHNLIVMISYIILIPLIEEFLFRGIIFNYIENSRKGNHAVLLSSLLYGLVHFSFILIVIYFVIGYVMAVIYRKTRSLLMPVLVHIIYNFIVILTLNFSSLTRSDGFKYTIIFLIIPTVLLTLKLKKETLY